MNAAAFIYGCNAQRALIEIACRYAEKTVIRQV